MTAALFTSCDKVKGRASICDATAASAIVGRILAQRHLSLLPVAAGSTTTCIWPDSIKYSTSSCVKYELPWESLYALHVPAHVVFPSLFGNLSTLRRSDGTGDLEPRNQRIAIVEGAQCNFGGELQSYTRGHDEGAMYRW